MDREQFALRIFSEQDERVEEECFADLLISQSIIDAKDSDEFKTEMFYWMNQIERAIQVAEDLEDEDGGTINLE